MVETLKIWLYPDNPMSKGTLALFIIIAIYLVKNNFLRLVINDIKEINKKSTSKFEGNDWESENEEVDVIHAIGQNLASYSGAYNLKGLQTYTGNNAEEVYFFMENLIESARDFLRNYDRKLDSNEFRSGDVNFIIKGENLILCKTEKGNVKVSVDNLRTVAKNPYKFDIVAKKFNLV